MAPLAVWKVTVMFYEATGTWPPPPGPPDPAPPPPASLIISPDFFSFSLHIDEHDGHGREGVVEHPPRPLRSQPCQQQVLAAPPLAAARFWPTPSPRGRGRLGRSLALLLCVAYLSLARPRGEGGAQERARARGRAGAVCCLGADSAGGAGGVQKRRAGRDLGALRERLQAEDEQRDRGASERRRGRAARPRTVAVQ